MNFGDGLSVISSPSLFYTSKSVDFEFKDELNVTISISGMDLTKYTDLMVYK